MTDSDNRQKKIYKLVFLRKTGIMDTHFSSIYFDWNWSSGNTKMLQFCC